MTIDLVTQTQSCYYMGTDLQPDTKYKIKIRGLSGSGQYENVISSEVRTTKDTQPASVGEISVKELYSNNNQTASAHVRWSLSPDLPCQYQLVIWRESGRPVSYPELLQVKFPDDLSGIVLSNLQYDTSYKIGVSALSSSNQESDTKWTNLVVPSCLDFFPGNLSICRPLPPSNLSVQDQSNNSGDCELFLTWDVPKTFPSYYNLNVTSYGFEMENYQIFTFNVTGNASQTILKTLTKGTNYLIFMKAMSPGGFSDPVKYQVKNICGKDFMGSWISKIFKKRITSIWVITILIVLLIILVSITSVLLIYYKRKTSESENYKSHNFKSLKKFTESKRREHNSQTIADKFEIPKESLILCDMIGEGAFGVVHKGLLTKPNGTPDEEVAVKMLRDHPDSEDLKQFQKEIALMKTVGKHKNIVSLIGCCTQSCRLMLVVEFCANGDLQNYLRQEWKKQMEADTELQENSKYVNLMAVNTSESNAMPVVKRVTAVAGLVSNALYDFNTNRGVDNTTKSLAERLLSFMRQIAIGMEYLASNRVVHRDLAARNVLVCNDQSIKISDFGLSRDVYEQNIYYKKGSEKLPVKWMALESLLHQIYTTQSDVWSFGVLLWEIVTLGGNPYPSTPTNQMFSLLKKGFRMEQPPTCCNQLYSIMMDCWKEKPSERPTFTKLVKRLTELLESATPHQYLDLEQMNKWGDREENGESFS